MQILNEFGFQPILFAAQIVNFLILLYIFNRFLYKPLLKSLSDREKKIKQGLTDAEKAAADRANAEEEKSNIIKAAGIEAEKILSETKKAADELKEEILTNARKEADTIIETGKQEAKLERENMEKSVKSAALDLSAALLEHALQDVFSKDDRDKMMKRSMEMLKKSKAD